jgi:hypothetical protein
VVIDATHASGPPVENGGQIRSQENTPITAHGLERIVKGATAILKEESDEQKSVARVPRKPGIGQKPAPKPHSD